MRLPELPLDLPLQPMVRRDVALAPVRAAPTRDRPNEPPSPVDDHGARVALVGEAIIFGRLSGVVAEHEELDGVDLAAGVLAGDRLEAVDAAKGGAGRAPGLDREEGLRVVDVVVLRIAHLVLGHVVLELEEEVRGDVQVGSVVRLGKHVRFPVDGGLVSACRQRGVSEKKQRERHKIDSDPPT